MEKDIQYTSLLKQQLQQFFDENRFLEFKSNYQDVDRIGKYISALSNGACLDNEQKGYLYFGVDDATHAVKGTKFDYTHEKAIGNQNMELYLRRMLSPKINFTIEEFLYENTTRVVVFIIPAAEGEPTTYQGKPYIRVNSQTTELTPYTDWLRAIYNSKEDWSAQVIEGASLKDLDIGAVRIAREGYKQRFPKFAKECDSWSDEVFLDKAGLTTDGKITRTTLLLVGKEESVHYLHHIAQIVWKCVQDGQTFGDIYTIPFVRTTSELLGRIRNYRFKIYPKNSLIPAEVWKYDTESILEAMHNALAHQDYLCNARIIVHEDSKELTFQNDGRFYDGDYTMYITGEKTPKGYRNPMLVKAMVNIKMIDTQGYGIHKMFLSQKERFLPMPDYNRSTANEVVLTMPGTVIDENYSLMLLERKDLTLQEIVLLDKVQKGEPVSAEAVALLRKKKLVEGRKNSLIVAKEIAQITDQKAQYTRNKGMNDQYYRDFIEKAIDDHKSMSRKDIVELLWDKLPEVLDDKKKNAKIANLLTALRKAGKIKIGKGKTWQKC